MRELECFLLVTKGAMVKWRPQLDSAPQIGLEIFLEGVLIGVGSGIAGTEDVGSFNRWSGWSE